MGTTNEFFLLFLVSGGVTGPKSAGEAHARIEPTNECATITAHSVDSSSSAPNCTMFASILEGQSVKLMGQEFTRFGWLNLGQTPRIGRLFHGNFRGLAQFHPTPRKYAWPYGRGLFGDNDLG